MVKIDELQGLINRRESIASLLSKLTDEVKKYVETVSELEFKSETDTFECLLRDLEGMKGDIE